MINQKALHTLRLLCERNFHNVLPVLNKYPIPTKKINYSEFIKDAYKLRIFLEWATASLPIKDCVDYVQAKLLLDEIFEIELFRLDIDLDKIQDVEMLEKENFKLFKKLRNHENKTR